MKMYLFTYSGNWEGFRRFYKLNRLLDFLQKIPEYELSKTVVMKKKKDIFFVGSYYKTKRGLKIRF